MHKRYRKHFTTAFLVLIMVLELIPMPRLVISMKPDTGELSASLKEAKDARQVYAAIENNRPEGKDYGDFKNVQNRLEIVDDSGPELRQIEGTLEFDWPAPAQFKDVIIMQDASYSFGLDSKTVELMNDKVTSLVKGLNFGLDVDGVSPKDRIMFVSFKGNDLRGAIDESGIIHGDVVKIKPDDSIEYGTKNQYLFSDGHGNYSGGYEINTHGGLHTNRGADGKSAAGKAIKDLYQRGYFRRITPTLDGMVVAEQAYKESLDSSKKYNKSSYVVTDALGGQQDRKRETIYILITDGPGNAATWNNLVANYNDTPVFRKPAPNDITGKEKSLIYDLGINADQIPGRHPRNSRITRNHSVLFLFSNFAEVGLPRFYAGRYAGGSYDYDGSEIQHIMRVVLKNKAKQMREHGGVFKAANDTKGGPAKFVTIFWENLHALKERNGANRYDHFWDDLRNDTISTFRDMSDGKLFTSTDRETFLKGIENVLTSSSVVADVGRIDLIAKPGVKFTGGLELQKEDVATDEWSNVTGIRSEVTPSSLRLLLNNLDPGHYRVNYKMEELVFKPQDYQPLSINMVYLGDPVQPAIDYIPANDTPGVTIDIKKFGGEEIATSVPGSGSIDSFMLQHRRPEEFYFNTFITFTDVVQHVQNELVFSDKLDPRLELVEAVLVNNTPTGPDAPDAVTSATLETYRPEQNGDSVDSGFKFDKQENTISYIFEKGAEHTSPFKDYAKQSYVFVIKVRIRDEVTDAEIDQVIYDNGFANQSKIYMDGEYIASNVTRAIPPAFKMPQLSKYIDKSEGESWSPNIYLPQFEDTFRYRLTITLPKEDVSSYKKITIEDILDENLMLDMDTSNPNALNLAYVKYGDYTDQSSMKPVIETNYSASFDDTTNKFAITFENDDNSNFFQKVVDYSVQANSDASIQVILPVKLKEGADLSSKIINDEILITNRASLTVNDYTELIYSDSVATSIAWPSMNVQVVDGTNKLGLKDARFTLTSSENTSLSFTSLDDGHFILPNLTPGGEYTLRQESAPAGYLKDQSIWTIIVDKSGHISYFKDGDQNGRTPITKDNKTLVIENSRPKNPSITKEAFVVQADGQIDGDQSPDSPQEVETLTLPSNNSHIRYKITIPLTESEGYNILTIQDKLSPFLTYQNNSLKVYLSENQNGETLESDYSSSFYNFSQALDNNTGENVLTLRVGNLDQGDNQDKKLNVEFDVVVKSNLDALFEKHHDGTIPNTAEVWLGDSNDVIDPSTSNTITVQVSRSDLTINKTKSKVEGEDTVTTPLSVGESATFILQERRGDIYVDFGDPIVISGADSEDTISNIPPGQYRLLEAEAPLGYSRIEGSVVEFEVPASGGDVDDVDIDLQEHAPTLVKVDRRTVTVNNPKTEDVTIDKYVSIRPNNFNIGAEMLNYQTFGKKHKIGIGESWLYAIDLTVPNSPSTDYNLTITDSVPEYLKLQGLNIYALGNEHLRNSDAKWKPIGRDKLGQYLVHPGPGEVTQKIQVEIPGDHIRGELFEGYTENYTIRIIFQVKVNAGTNLQEEVVQTGGYIDNTATLKLTPVNLESEEEPKASLASASIQPTALRDIKIQTLLGKEALPRVNFSLHKLDEDGSLGRRIAVHPFTGKEYSKLSDIDGKVVFKDVPEGEYFLVEETPEGYLGIDPIKIKVNDFLTASAPVEYLSDQGKLSDSDFYEIRNNQLVDVKGKVQWFGDEDVNEDRPSLKLDLYRKTDPDSDKILIGNKTIKANSFSEQDTWSYEFDSDDLITPDTKLLKFDKEGNEYIYEVKITEDGNDGVLERYEEEQAGFDFKYTLKTYDLYLKKINGDSSEPIAGTEFMLIKPGAYATEIAATNEEGVLKFSGLEAGQEYSFTEVDNEESRKYIYNSGEVKVKVGADGISLVPDFDKEITSYEGKNVEAYVLKNYPLQKPRKEIKVDGSFQTSSKAEPVVLSDYSETVYYRIILPVTSINDIKSIQIRDELAIGLDLKENSFKVYSVDPQNVQGTYIENNDVTEYFDIAKSKDSVDGNLALAIKSKGVDDLGIDPNDEEKFTNRDLYFEFGVFFNTDIGTVLDNNPDGIIANTATVDINDSANRGNELEPRSNLRDTNSVYFRPAFIDLELPKFVETQIAEGNLGKKELTSDQRAIFSLKRETSVEGFKDYPFGGRDNTIANLSTNADSKLILPPLGPGRYVLSETQAPEGYELIAPIEFEVRWENDVLKAYTKDDNAEFTVYVEDNKFMDAVDPLPEPPEIKKYVFSGDPGEEVNSNELNMESWTDTVQYRIELSFPEDLSNYYSLEITDEIPPVLDIVEGSILVGAYASVDNDQKLESLSSSLTDKVKFIEKSNTIKLTIEDSNDLKLLSGTKVHINYKVKINDIFQTLESIEEYLIDEKLENTASVTVNDSRTILSSAYLKPVDLFEIHFKTIADHQLDEQEVALGGARFRIRPYRLGIIERGIFKESHQGKQLPLGMPTTYSVENKDGVLTLPARLETGKYIIELVSNPEYYYSYDAERVGWVGATYTTDHIYYLLELPENSDANPKLSPLSAGTSVWSKSVDPTAESLDIVVEGNADPLLGLPLTGSGSSADPFVIEFAEIMRVPVRKIWDDDNNLHRLRPEEIYYKLQRAIAQSPLTTDSETNLPKSYGPGTEDTPDDNFNDLVSDDSKNGEYDLSGKIDTDRNEFWFTSEAIDRFKPTEQEMVIQLRDVREYDDKGKLNFPKVRRYIKGTKTGEKYIYYVLEKEVDNYAPEYKYGEQVPEYGFQGLYAYDYTVEITNKLNSVEHLAIKKVSEDGDTYLQGAEFNLSYKPAYEDENSTTRITKTFTTDDRGNISLDNYLLPSTEYKLEEVKAPKNHLLNGNTYRIKVDNEGVPKIYLNDEQEAIETVGQDVNELKITNETAKFERLTHTINGEESYQLKQLDDSLRYEIKLDIASVEFFESLILKSQLNPSQENKLLAVIPDTAEITADGKDISEIAGASLKVEFSETGDQVTYALEEGDFSALANRQIILSFKAKVRDGVDYKELESFLENNTKGIANQVSLTVNGELVAQAPNQTESDLRDYSYTYVTVGKLGGKPTIRKMVDKQEELQLARNKQVFTYRIRVDVPDNVLGYRSLSIKDRPSRFIKPVEGSIEVYIAEFTNSDLDSTYDTLQRLKEYNSGKPNEKNVYKLTNSDPVIGGDEQKDGLIEVELHNFDFGLLAGKSLVVEFDAQLRDGLNDDDIKNVVSDYKIPNTAELWWNTEDGATESTNSDVAYVIPQAEPVIEKSVAVGDNNFYKEHKLNYDDLAKQITYQISVDLPYNLQDYNEIKITDGISEVFSDEHLREDPKTVVSIKDIENADYAVAYDENSRNLTIELVPDAEGDFSKFSGKQLLVQIELQLDQTKNLLNFFTGTGLTNKAILTTNQTPSYDSSATIKLLNASASFTKLLDGGGEWPAGETAEFILERRIKNSTDNELNVEVQDEFVWEQVGENVIFYAQNPTIEKKLPVGDYRLREIKAPAGYLLADPLEFKIANDMKESEEITNTKAPAYLKKSTDKEYFKNFSDTIQYTLEFPVYSIVGLEEIQVIDQLPDSVSASGIKTEIGTTEEGSDEIAWVPKDGLASEYNDNNNKISLIIKDSTALAEVENKLVRITYSIKLKEGFEYDDLTPEEKESGIINTAKLLVNGNETVTAEAKVRIPVGSLSVVKTVDEGKPLPPGTAASFEIYKVAENDDVSEDTLIGSFTTTKVGHQGKIVDKFEVKNLEPGSYYLRETAAPQGYVLNDREIEFTLSLGDNGDIVFESTNENGESIDYPEIIVDNIKSQNPTIEKKIKNGESHFDHMNLTKFDEKVTYIITVPKIHDTQGWQQFTITDQIDPLLKVDVDSIKVTVSDGNHTETYKIDETDETKEYLNYENNLITFSFTQLDKVKALVGKTVILTFDATISSGVSMEDIGKAHYDYKIPNTANLDIGQGPSSSNTVTIMPPGDAPTIDKKVDNATETRLGSKNQSFDYDIRVKIPANVEGYTSVLVEDQLDTVLETAEDRITVYLGDNVDESLKSYLRLEGNTITFDINKAEDPAFDFSKLAGQTLRISINANIKAGTSSEDLNLKKDKDTGDVRIANKATLIFNENEPFETDSVFVIPPGDKPNIEKTVAIKGTEEKEDDINLSDLTDKITYRIKLSIPENVEGYESIIIEDIFEPVWDVNYDNISVSVIGEYSVPIGFSQGLELTDRKLSFNLPKDDDGTFKSYAGKTIELAINTKLNKNETIDSIAYKYGSSAIPNGARLIFNGETINSNVVQVIAPPAQPNLTKTVNGKSEEILSNVEDTFVYNLSFSLPVNVLGLETISLIDEFKNAISIQSEDIMVFVNELLETDLKPKLDGGGQKLTLSLDLDKDTQTSYGTGLEVLAGKTIRVQVSARFKEGTDFTQYDERKVTNQARLEINQDKDKPVLSDKVSVRPPLGDVILTKLVDGEPLSGDQTAKFALYKIVNDIDDLDNEEDDDVQISSGLENDNFVFVIDESNQQIELDGILDPGRYYFKEVESPKGYIKDETPIEFEIKANQTISVALVMNNLRATKDLSVTKVWQDAGNNGNTRPQEITLKAIQSGTGKEFTKVFKVSNDNEEAYTINNLPSYDAEGNAYSYTIDEVDVAGYSKSIDQDAKTITNTLKDTVDVVFEKRWVGGPESKPAVTVELQAKVGEVPVYLKANAEGTGYDIDPAGTKNLSITVNSEDDYKGEFSNLPRYDAAGNIISYSVAEVSITTDDGTTYEVVDGRAGDYLVSQLGNVIINTYLPATTSSVSVRKVWEGGSLNETNTPVELVLVRKAGDKQEIVGDIVQLEPVEEGLKQEHTWTDLPTHDNTGVEYEYSVKEVNTPAGYEAHINPIHDDADNPIQNQFEITNTYNPELQDITAIKRWVGGAKARPEITLTLYRNVEGGTEELVPVETNVIENPIVLSGDKFEYTWYNLPVTDEAGQTYYYYVKETKIGDEVVDNTDDPVGNYLIEHNGLVVTNTFVQDIKVTKTWAEDTDHAHTREEIQLQLFRQAGTDNKEFVGEPITIVPEEGKDSYDFTWKNLPTHNRNNEAYTYSVDEVEVPLGYKKEISGDAASGFKVTNTYSARPDSVEIRVDKLLDGRPLIDGEFTFDLYEGESTYEKDFIESVNNDIFGNANFTSLTFEKPGEYTYTVKEKEGNLLGVTYSQEEYRVKVVVAYDKHGVLTATASYKKAVDAEYQPLADLEFTNVYEEELINLYIEKTWQDDNNKLQTRPEHITFAVYKDNEFFMDRSFKVADGDSVTDTETYVIYGLPKYTEDGEEITYSVRELPVYSYESTQNENLLGKGTENDPFKVTNTLSDTLDVSFELRWVGGPEPKPAVTVELQAKVGEGDPYEQNTLSLDPGALNGVFENLPRYNNLGAPISYTVEEVSIGDVPVIEGQAGNYQVEIEEINGHFIIINKYVSPTINVTVNKNWSGGDENNRPTIELQLFRSVEGGAEVFVGTEPISLPQGSDNSWTYTWTGLEQTDENGNQYTYSVKEINPPTGYTPTDVEKSVDKDTGNLSFDVTNTYNSELQDITAIKRWVGGPKARPEITLTLYRTTSAPANGEYVYDGNLVEADASGSTIEAATLSNGEIEYTWHNLPVTDKAGQTYYYYVKETKIGDEVVNNTEGPVSNYWIDHNGLLVTNTYVSDTTTIYAKKDWVGGPDNKPEVHFQLMRNGQIFKKPIRVAPENNEVTWVVDKTDEYGQAYVYDVVEIDVPNNYNQTDKTGTGTKENPIKITNTYTPGLTSHTVTKEWNNGPEEKPAVTVALYRKIGSAGSEEPVVSSMVSNVNAFTNPVTINEGSTVASYTWANLPLTDEEGREITYFAKELKVGLIDVSQNDVGERVAGNYKVVESTKETTTTITNSYTSPKIDLVGKKTWVNDGDVRPDSIQVELLRDDESVDPDGEGPATQTIVEVKADGDGLWKYEFKDLDKTNSSGQDYVYTVREVKVPEGYEVSYAGNDIINTYVGTASVEITKIWQDAGNNGNTRPQEITLKAIQNTGDSENLVATGEVFTKVFTVTDEGKYVIDGLPKYDEQGKQFTYTIDEVDVPGYSKSIDPDAKTITNTLKDTVDVAFEKLWVGGPEQKPAVTIGLSASVNDKQVYVVEKEGTYSVKTSLEEGDVEAVKELYHPDTKGSFTGLPKYDGTGVEITYSVAEVSITTDDGTTYDVVDGRAGDYTVSQLGNVITNTYQTDKIDIYAKKLWVGDNGLETSRPNVEFTLYRNGEFVRESEMEGEQSNPITINGSEQEISWTGLDKTDAAGNVYTYTVVETKTAPGYSSSSATGSGTQEDPFVITNTLRPTGSLVLQKTDRYDKPLSGVLFWLVDYDNHSFIDNGKTNELGVVQFDRLRPGKYYLQEKVGLPGYRQVESELAIHVDENSSVTIAELPEGWSYDSGQLTVRNVNIEGSLNLRIVDGYDNRPLAGAIFSLYEDADGATIAKDAQGNEFVATSGNDGKLAFNGLKPGTYYLIENQAPAGYQRFSGSHKVTVDINGVTRLDGVNLEQNAYHTIINNKIPEKGIEVIKQDNEGNPLRGAEFSLYRKTDATASTLEFKVDFVLTEAARIFVEDGQPGEIVLSLAANGDSIDLENDISLDRMLFNLASFDQAITVPTPEVTTTYSLRPVEVPAGLSVTQIVGKNQDGTYIFEVSVDVDTPEDGITSQIANEDLRQELDTLIVHEQALIAEIALRNQTDSTEIQDDIDGELSTESADGATSSLPNEESPSKDHSSYEEEAFIEDESASFEEPSSAEPEYAPEVDDSENEEESDSEDTAEAGTLFGQIEFIYTASEENYAELNLAEFSLAELDDMLKQTQERIEQLNQQLLNQADGPYSLDHADSDQPMYVDLTISPPLGMASSESLQGDMTILPPGYEPVEFTVEKDHNVIRFLGLQPGSYFLKEDKAPIGYLGKGNFIGLPDGSPIVITEDETALIPIVVKNNPETRNLTIRKYWYKTQTTEYPQEWPQGYTIDITLYADGVPIMIPSTVSVGQGGFINEARGQIRMTEEATRFGGYGYELVLSGLPKTDGNGQDIIYSLTEVINEPDLEVPYYYYPKVGRPIEVDGVIEMHNLDPPKNIQVSVETRWENDRTRDLPDFWITLLDGDGNKAIYNNGTEVDQILMSSANKWQYTYDDIKNKGVDGYSLQVEELPFDYSYGVIKRVDELTSKINFEIIIDGPADPVPQYIIGPVDPNEVTNPNPDLYWTVHFSPGSHGYIGRESTYYVLKSANLTLASLSKPQVTTAEGWKHTGWDLPESTLIAGNLDVTAIYEPDDVPYPLPTDPDQSEPEETSVEPTPAGNKHIEPPIGKPMEPEKINSLPATGSINPLLSLIAGLGLALIGILSKKGRGK